MHSLR